MPNATEAYDDLGHLWAFDKDSPAAVMDACKRSVRRWRLQKLGQALPGLIPQDTDNFRASQEGSILIDCSGQAANLIKGKGISRDVDFWRSQLSPYLLSAMAAGQWTQARRASVPSFGITDSKCRLCMQHTGAQVRMPGHSPCAWMASSSSQHTACHHQPVGRQSADPSD